MYLESGDSNSRGVGRESRPTRETMPSANEFHLKNKNCIPTNADYALTVMTCSLAKGLLMPSNLPGMRGIELDLLSDAYYGNDRCKMTAWSA